MAEEKLNQDMVFNPSFLEDTSIKKDPDNKEQKEELNLFENIGLIQEANKKQVNDEPGQKVEKIDNSQSPDNTKGSSLFSVVLGKDLTEAGALSTFDEEKIKEIATKDGDEAAIKYMFQKQLEVNKKELQTNDDSQYQEYLTMVSGGVSKQEATGIVQLENFAKSFKGMDLKGEDDNAVQARKDILTLNYRLNTKFSDDKITKLVNKSYEDGSDVDEVDEASQNILEYIAETKQNNIKQAQDQKIARETAIAKYTTDQKALIETTDEYFKGDKVTKVVKEKMIKLLTSPAKLKDGSINNQLWAKRDENPIAFDAKVAYLEAIGFFDDKPLDKFVKNAETKVTTGLQAFLQDNEGRSYKGSMGKSFSETVTNKEDPFSIFLK